MSFRFSKSFLGLILVDSDLGCFTMLVDAETALYTELSRTCAGLLVTVPREKELVYYFPQCHIQQVFLINFFYSNALSLMFIFRFMQVFHGFLHFFCLRAFTFICLNALSAIFVFRFIQNFPGFLHFCALSSFTSLLCFTALKDRIFFFFVNFW